LGRVRNLSATNGSLCISTRVATGWGTHLSPPRIAEDASFTKIGPPTTLEPDYTYLRPPPPPSPSFTCAMLAEPLGTGPGFIELDKHGIPAVWPSASWQHCLTSPRSRQKVLVTGQRAAPRPFSQPPCGMSVSSRVHYKAVSSPLVSIRSLWPGFMSDPHPWCPAASSPTVSGRFISAGLRHGPLD
jgi:hypothetical protein